MRLATTDAPLGIRKSWRGPASTFAGFLAVLLLFVEGCARTEWLALMPPEGQEPAQVERDREECAAEARPSAGQVGSGAMKGMVIHAAGPPVGMGVGALAGLAWGLQGSGSSASGKEAAIAIAGGAAAGAVVGFVTSLVLAVKKPSEELDEARRQAYDACLRKRDYTFPRGDRQ